MKEALDPPNCPGRGTEAAEIYLVYIYVHGNSITTLNNTHSVCVYVRALPPPSRSAPVGPRGAWPRGSCSAAPGQAGYRGYCGSRGC